jgi:transcriptional regulator GlxA family with amidase domain
MQPTATSTQPGGFANVGMMPASVSTAVMKLLADAGMMIDADQIAAKSFLERATALLQAERLDAVPAGGETEGATRSGLAPWQIAKVKAHVEANLGSPIRVSVLADCCRLSTSYFSVAFKRSLGETVQAYLARRRVERAQEMILVTDESLSQIALDCGFCDQAHLSRMFRRLIGEAPNRWRRERSVAPARMAL